MRFAELIAPLGLTPPEAGILRLLGHEAGISHRALAARLGSAPSRIVVLVDSLEAKGLVVRRRSERDRRNHELHLTDPGAAALRQLRSVAADHETDVVAGLTKAEEQALHDLLGKLAAHHGLEPGVHPGYRGTKPATRGAPYS